ncbi:hypothetical protein [Clostridium algidicarnis]|uniref:hypothetical protein n=1 Tax=Clostridium algidicarnis TaxID=37659 RepID=UPI000494FE34|nr:hypothetical protein [Clostridium algidicarnis]
MKPKEITKYYLGYEIAIHNNFREDKANEDIIISKCSHCGKPFDRYINVLMMLVMISIYVVRNVKILMRGFVLVNAQNMWF